MAPSRVPLFPLEMVLFPGMALTLHIFEPQYKPWMPRLRRVENLCKEAAGNGHSHG